jgi:hypothetical protein
MRLFFVTHVRVSTGSSSVSRSQCRDAIPFLFNPGDLLVMGTDDLQEHPLTSKPYVRGGVGSHITWT